MGLHFLTLFFWQLSTAPLLQSDVDKDGKKKNDPKDACDGSNHGEDVHAALHSHLDHCQVCPHLVLCKAGVFPKIPNLKILDEKPAGTLPFLVLGYYLQTATLLHWLQVACLPTGLQPDQPGPV